MQIKQFILLAMEHKGNPIPHTHICPFSNSGSLFPLKKYHDHSLTEISSVNSQEFII